MGNDEGKGNPNKKHLDITSACSTIVSLLAVAFSITSTTLRDQRLKVIITIIECILFATLLVLLVRKIDIEKGARILSKISFAVTGILIFIQLCWMFPKLFPIGSKLFPEPSGPSTTIITVRNTPGIPQKTVEPTPTATASPTPSPVPDRAMLTPEEAKKKIAAGYDFTILLRSDGTVVSFGGKEIDTSNWENIVQVAAYGDHALGLCENGSVVCTGINVLGECDVSGWSNVKQLSACYQGSIAVTNDGRVLYTGFNKNHQSDCTNWTGMDRILGGEDHILGLATNGRVYACGYSSDHRNEVSDYSNVIAGDAANGSTFVVLSDHSVKTIGKNWANEDNVGGWENIIDVSGGDVHTVGLRENGTVVCSGSNEDGQCNVKAWSNVVAICAGQYHTVGLCADGTLLATGLDTSGQCDVSGANYWVEN